MHALALLQAAETEVTMGTGGWVFMGIAWVLVTGLVVWCFAKVLGGPKPS